MPSRIRKPSAFQSPIRFIRVLFGALLHGMLVFVDDHHVVTDMGLFAATCAMCVMCVPCFFYVYYACGIMTRKGSLIVAACGCYFLCGCARDLFVSLFCRFWRDQGFWGWSNKRLSSMSLCASCLDWPGHLTMCKVSRTMFCTSIWKKAREASAQAGAYVAVVLAKA